MSTLFQDLKNVETSIVADAEAVGQAIEGIFVDDVEPFFKNALALVERNGGSTLIKVASDVAADVATGQWGTAVAQIISDVESAGVTLVQGEEQLAASTALQIVQAAGSSLSASAPSAPELGSSTSEATPTPVETLEAVD